MSLTVSAIPFTFDPLHTNHDYLDKIEDIILKSPQNFVGVLPEYCWGALDQASVLENVDHVQGLLSQSQYMMLGSAPLDHNGAVYNSGILVGGNGLRKFYPKRNVLDEETKRGVVSGINPGVTMIGTLKVQSVICADLWNAEYLLESVVNDGIDLLLVPAFTAVPKGYSAYARTQWHSLALTRSREFIVPIVVADHYLHQPRYDVGQVTCIVDPSRKMESMKTIGDFMIHSPSEVISYEIDFSNIEKYRNYRKNKGIYLSP